MNNVIQVNPSMVDEVLNKPCSDDVISSRGFGELTDNEKAEMKEKLKQFVIEMGLNPSYALTGVFNLCELEDFYEKC